MLNCDATGDLVYRLFDVDGDVVAAVFPDRGSPKLDGRRRLGPRTGHTQWWVVMQDAGELGTVYAQGLVEELDLDTGRANVEAILECFGVYEVA